jgi:hypothetical protein
VVGESNLMGYKAEILKKKMIQSKKENTSIHILIRKGKGFFHENFVSVI